MSIETRTVTLQMHPALSTYLDWLEARGRKFKDSEYVLWRTAYEAAAGPWPPNTVTTISAGTAVRHRTRRDALVWPHLSPKFGERPGQDPRAHDVEAPLPTVTADGAGRLVSAIALPSELADIDRRRLVVIDGVLHLLDIKFRMLKNSELAAAMGFPVDYQFSGNKGDVTKQIGNAVPVGLARALVGAILDPEQATELAS